MSPFIIDEEGGISLCEGLMTLECAKTMYTLKYNKRAGDTDGRDRKRYHKEIQYIYHMYSWSSSFRESPADEKLQAVLDELEIDKMEISPEMAELIEHVERMQLNDVGWSSLVKTRALYERFERLMEATEDIVIIQNYFKNKPAIIKALKEEENAFYASIGDSEGRGGAVISDWERG